MKGSNGEVRISKEVWAEVQALDQQAAAVVARRDALIMGALLNTGARPGRDGFAYNVNIADRTVTRTQDLPVTGR